MFWRNPSAAFFNFLLPLLFLAGGGAILARQPARLNQLVPAIAGMSVMSTTFTALAYNIVFLRERGVLKRIRGTPLPTISYFGGVAAQRRHQHGAADRDRRPRRAAAVRDRLAARLGRADRVRARRRRLLRRARRRLRARDPQLRVDRRLRQRGVPAGRVRLLLRVRLQQRPGFLRTIADALPLKPLIDGLSGAMVTGSALGNHLDALAVIALWGAFGLYFAVRGFSWEQSRT